MEGITVLLVVRLLVQVVLVSQESNEGYRYLVTKNNLKLLLLLPLCTTTSIVVLELQSLLLISAITTRRIHGFVGSSIAVG